MPITACQRQSLTTRKSFNAVTSGAMTVDTAALNTSIMSMNSNVVTRALPKSFFLDDDKDSILAASYSGIVLFIRGDSDYIGKDVTEDSTFARDGNKG